MNTNWKLSLSEKVVLNNIILILNSYVTEQKWKYIEVNPVEMSELAVGLDTIRKSILKS